MARLLSFCLGLIILASAYIYSYGVPPILDFSIGASPEVAVNNGKSQPTNGRRRGGGGQTVVTLGEVEQASYSDVLRAIGTSEAVNNVEVISDVSGQVEQIFLKANSAVKAGDILVKLDDRTEAINLEIANGTRQQAQNQVDRYARLGSSNSVVSEVTVQEAKTTLLQSQLQFDLAQNALDERTIRAPIDGVLGLSKIKMGSNLSVGTSIATIEDIDDLLVEFELPERALALLAKQEEVLLSTPVIVGKVFKGKIFAYNNRIDSVTRTITVQARINNDERLLLPGMSFGVRMINESELGAVVPTNAITWTRNGSQIWVVKDNIANSVPTSIVMRQQDRVWIDAKLEAGTSVVIEGTQKLRNGIKISTANSEPKRDDSERLNPPSSEGTPIADARVRPVKAEAAQ